MGAPSGNRNARVFGPDGNELGIGVSPKRTEAGCSNETSAARCRSQALEGLRENDWWRIMMNRS
jgi:hypothetical protein